MGARGVFLVTGLPATGKTTLARALAHALAAPLLSKDCIKEPLLEVLGAPDAHTSRRLSDAVWVASADQRSDAFLDIPGPRYVHDGGVTDPKAGPALIRSLAIRHLV